MMVYFIQGKLPWQGLRAHDCIEKDRLVMEKKMAVDVKELCSGLPEEFANYMRYVKSLKQGQQPDYPWLRSLFRYIAETNHIAHDNVFDWTVRMCLQQKEQKTSR
jgi:hypothetical protein